MPTQLLTVRLCQGVIIVGVVMYVTGIIDPRIMKVSS